MLTASPNVSAKTPRTTLKVGAVFFASGTVFTKYILFGKVKIDFHMFETEELYVMQKMLQD